MSHLPEPTASADSGDAAPPSGRRVVFWMFVGLSLATAVALLLLMVQVPPQYRLRVKVALVGNLLLPWVAWPIFARINRTRSPV